GIARRAADAFAYPIEHTDHEYLRPTRCQGNEGTRNRRHAVAEQYERTLGRRSIRKVPGSDLHEAVDGFGGAFDDAERDSAGAENARQEEWQERINRFGRRISREADPS